jgi:hypothetical protein
MRLRVDAIEGDLLYTDSANALTQNRRKPGKPRGLLPHFRARRLHACRGRSRADAAGREPCSGRARRPRRGPRCFAELPENLEATDAGRP